MHLFSTISFFLLTGAITSSKLHFPAEHHLSNIRQLTFGGQNAEGYFSFDGNWLTFQASGIPEYGTSCDQIYKLDLTILPEKQVPQRISTGIGTCTCSYFYPDNRHMIYAGTFQRANFTSSINIDSCPTKTCQTQRAKSDPRLRHLCNTTYTWDLFPEYDIFKVNEFGTVISRLTDTVGYDAEGAVSPDGRKIVFTSVRSGDPEIWIMNSDGTEPKQLTDELGYDGGPFFSPDGSKIVFRASRPNTSDEIQTYKDLLSYNLVSPLEMELYTINIDGSGLRKVTSLGGSNWAPFYMPDNRHIIFSSNFNETGGHFGAFNLYMINEAGGNVERITFNEGGFDAFPMFDRTGRRLVWGSSRNGRSRNELNLFIADWHDTYTMKIGNEIKKENSTFFNLRSAVMEKNSPKKVEQLTKGDINMAGSFSFDDKRIIYEGFGTQFYDTTCEQVFDLDLTSSSRRIRRLSTGIGASRSPVYTSDSNVIIYASNILTANRSALNSCPRRVCTDTRQSWIKEICYDGEASISSDGRYIIFTSRRNGDPDLWTMDIDGKNSRQITKTVGYEGGAKLSPDGRFIVFHASRPTLPIQLIEYYWLLWQYNAVELANTQIFLMHNDGSGLRQLTRNGTNLWPTFLSNKRILFASKGILANRTFNIFAVNIDGSELEQITTDRDYSNFYPAISHDGLKLLWSRSITNVQQLNLYLALIGKI
ncbi:unnamed protein product [Cercopithifilaria johnstoni]|uniref:Uncharacterized protein n=1 Tax=Cercopithifilaria johnstoni TaxID=2874296 RepID=A0A8J2M135_9BILA|nr:unnamed protein product [Cercopithifilaria johnstoni]